METKYSELELLVKTQKNYLEHYEEQIKTEKESNQKYYQKLQAMIAQIEVCRNAFVLFNFLLRMFVEIFIILSVFFLYVWQRK